MSFVFTTDGSVLLADGLHSGPAGAATLLWRLCSPEPVLVAAWLGGSPRATAFAAELRALHGIVCLLSHFLPESSVPDPPVVAWWSQDGGSHVARRMGPDQVPAF